MRNFTIRWLMLVALWILGQGVLGGGLVLPVLVMAQEANSTTWQTQAFGKNEMPYIFEGNLYILAEHGEAPKADLFDPRKSAHLIEGKAPEHAISVLSERPVYRDQGGKLWLLARDGELLIQATQPEPRVTWCRGPWRFPALNASKGYWNQHAFGEYQGQYWMADQRGLHKFGQGEWNYIPLIKNQGSRPRALLSAWDQKHQMYYAIDPGDQWVEEVEVEQFVVEEIEDPEAEGLGSDDLNFSTEDKVMYISPKIFRVSDGKKRELSLPEQWSGDDDPSAFAPFVEALCHQGILYLLRRDGLVMKLQQREKVDEQEMATLVAQLGVDDYEKRRKATKALVLLGEAGLNPIDDALAQATDPEVEWRLRSARHLIRSQRSAPVSVGDLIIDRVMSMAVDQEGRLFLFGVYAESRVYDILVVMPDGKAQKIQGLGISPSAWRQPYAIQGNTIWLSGQVDEFGRPVDTNRGLAWKIDLKQGKVVRQGPDLDHRKVIGLLKDGRAVLVSEKQSMAIEK